MKEALPASAAGQAIEIWFQDEARVGQKGSLEYIWAPIGSRPRAVRDNRHDSVYLFGALCAYRGVGAAIIMPAANTEAMNEHLKEISSQVVPGAHAVLVCDGAGWHRRGGKLKVPNNITLLSLPPYSPELTRLRGLGWFLILRPLLINGLSEKVFTTAGDWAAGRLRSAVEAEAAN